MEEFFSHPLPLLVHGITQGPLTRRTNSSPPFEVTHESHHMREDMGM
jgi:hypothetical protein